MKCAVLMDPPSQLIPYKDTTLALIKAAQKRGWYCVYFTEKTLFIEKGELYAEVFTLALNANLHSVPWAQIESRGFVKLSDFDLILMRKDPPFDLEYIYATYALEQVEKKGVLVINRPQSLRDVNEKYFTLNFPQCTPLSLVSKNKPRLKAFWEEHHNVIFKPLNAMGGRGVFHVDQRGENISVILDLLTEGETVSIMAQVYIPEIKASGDKRILMLLGEPIPYALARIPGKDDFRGNLAAGARGEVVPLNEHDYWICEQLAPTLKAKGLYFVGLDVIGAYLTEINVTSPTCLCEISAAMDVDLADQYLQSLEQLKLSLKLKS